MTCWHRWLADHFDVRLEAWVEPWPSEVWPDGKPILYDGALETRMMHMVAADTGHAAFHMLVLADHDEAWQCIDMGIEYVLVTLGNLGSMVPGVAIPDWAMADV
jgi:hypothetical protein